VIQSWRGQASLAEAARKGYRGILSFGYYLDHLQPASAHYKVDPLANAPDLLGPAEASRILGGEACMWSEYVSDQTVDSRLWPRAAAIAERLWSRRSVVDVDDMYARLEAVSRELDWVGVEHRSTYQRMLDRLAEGRPADGLRILADASEALGIDGRYKARAYSSEVPLNRFVDLVRPESESIRRLEQCARVFIANHTNSLTEVASLRISLSTWADNESRLSPPAELTSLSHKLTTVGSIGLQALEYLRTGTAAPAGWAARQGEILDEIQKPDAEVTLAAVRPVRLLVDAIAGKQADK
jgi:hexosaminidase